MANHSLENKDIYFKHKISENLPCDAYSMHVHNAYELIYFLDGDATHVIEDRKYKLKKGDLILIPPLKYHLIQIDSPSRYERYDILFDAERHNVGGVELISDGTEILSINLEDNRTAQDIFERCDLYSKNCTPELFGKILSHLLSELFYNIHLFPSSQSEKGAALSPLLTKVLAYINENLCTITDVAEIAGKLFVSESYLFRLFKKELHQTPKKYIREKRLLLAKKMLSAGEKPTDVCERCGFFDYTTFYRNYTAYFGNPPSGR